jgi:hypothetical protein
VTIGSDCCFFATRIILVVDWKSRGSAASVDFIVGIDSVIAVIEDDAFFTNPSMNVNGDVLVLIFKLEKKI